MLQTATGAELKATHEVVVPEITIRTQSGIRTRLDWVAKDSAGTIGCVECKASAMAPLTTNKAVAHPEIAQSGAVVVGKGKPGIPVSRAGMRYLADPATTSLDVMHGGVNFRVCVNVDQYGNPYIGSVHPIK